LDESKEKDLREMTSKGKRRTRREKKKKSKVNNIIKEKFNSSVNLNNKSNMKHFRKYGENLPMSNCREKYISKQTLFKSYGKAQENTKYYETDEKKKKSFKDNLDKNLKKRFSHFSNNIVNDRPKRQSKRIKKGGKKRLPIKESEYINLEINRNKSSQIKEISIQRLNQRSKDEKILEKLTESIYVSDSKQGDSSETRIIPVTPQKKLSLKTAYKVLKQHIFKLKNDLKIIFKEDLQNKYILKSNPTTSDSFKIIIDSKPKSKMVLVFGSKGNGLGLKNDQYEKKEVPISNELVSRSGRVVKNKYLLESIENQDQMEKQEMSFLQKLEKFCTKILKFINNGYFVYFKDYFSMVNKQINKLLTTFPFLSRRKVISLFSKDIAKVRDQFIHETSLEISKLSSHMSQFKINSKNHPRTHLQSRIFRKIEEYQIPESLFKSIEDCPSKEMVKKKYQVQNLLKSDKTPSCGKDCMCCTQPLEDFCKFKSFECNWESQCVDKQNKIECGDDCGCGEKCSNSFIKNKKFQINEEDISIRQTWGIDFYSRKNMFHLLPQGLNVDEKALIIDSILRQLNFLGHDGWNIILAIQKIIKKLKTMLKNFMSLYEEKDKKQKMKQWNQFLQQHCETKQDKIKKLKKLKRGLCILLKQLNIKQLRQHVKSFSKGLGVICINPEGIKSNNLIIRYLGEVYPPWFWYMKQDAIKMFLSRLNKNKFKDLWQYKDNYSMEFYNIYLEKHRDEPNGTELLVIDPILKGNYASRLSHSCSPNCVTMPVVSNKQYNIGKGVFYISNLRSIFFQKY
jgi:hypothetical protein